MPFKSDNPRGFEYDDLEVLDPLSIVAYLFDYIGISIPEETVEQYWSHYRSAEINSPWAIEHPAGNRHVPMGFYGDSCKIRQGEKMIGLFFNLPLWRPKSIRCSRFLLTAFREEHAYKRHTLDAVLRYLVWRFNLLLEAKYPSCGINGEPLPPQYAQRAGQDVVRGGRKFAITEVRGDWHWFKEVFSFKSSWKGGNKFPICFKCEARSIEPHLYYKVQPDSPCWTTEYDLPEFLVHQMPRKPSFSAQSLNCFDYLCFCFFIDHEILKL